MVYIYILKLDHGKWYVGKATDSPRSRIEQHFKGTARVKWTELHKPIDIEAIYPDCMDEDEDKWTIHYMTRYHCIDNVRGGTYCSIELPDYHVKSIRDQITGNSGKCYRCKSDDHFANDCPTANKPVNSGKKWRPEEDEDLMIQADKGISLEKMADYFGRTKTATESRIMLNIKKMIDSNNSLETLCRQYHVKIPTTTDPEDKKVKKPVNYGKQKDNKDLMIQASKNTRIKEIKEDGGNKKSVSSSDLYVVNGVNDKKISDMNPTEVAEYIRELRK